MDWEYINTWVRAMSQEFGGIVYDKEDGNRRLDWGQALCRQVFGIDWMNNPAWRDADNSPTVPLEVWKAAKKWRHGDWPEWAEV